MDNNSFKDQNGQGYPDLNNVPDNPYSHYYHEYLVDPGEKYVVPISRPRRVSTTVL